jgi:MOSC domain-containing protein YiiM
MAGARVGCGKFAQRFGAGAMRFVNSTMGRQLRLRGVNARVIQSGTVCVGDAASKLAGD